MTWLVAAAVVAAALAFRLHQVEGRSSPDCSYYLRMVGGEVVPRPYRGRVLVPLLARLLRLCGFETEAALRYVVLAGTVACVAVVMLTTAKIGGSASTIAAAGLAFVATDAVVGTWLLLPWLVDSWSLALGLAAFLSPDPVVSMALLLLAVLAKESGFAIGAALVVASHPALWWVAFPGVAALTLMRALPAAEPERAEQRTPVLEAFRRKPAVWFDYYKNLSGMKSTPWLAAALLPNSVFLVPAIAVLAVSWAQTLVAVDHARLVSMSAVFLVPVVAVSLPEWALWPWVLSMLFWPFRSECV